MELLKLESLALWISLIGYSLTCIIAIITTVFKKRPDRTLLALMSASVASHMLAIGARWIRLEHVPVSNSFELLSGNVCGLMIAVVLAYWLMPRVRGFIVIVMPVVIMLMAWMLLLSEEGSSLPASYHTIWLYIHIAFYKVFLGSAFIALGMAGIVLLRAAHIGRTQFSAMPSDLSLDQTAYRFMALALIFDTLGMVAGAIWAEDAWGRYWSWDTLEVWALVTWLSIGLMLHVRSSFRTGPATNALLILGSWAIAFFTFFGIPFVSTALHKGMV